MTRYQTIATTTLHCGILHLTPVQAAARSGTLADLGDGLYEIRGPVQFKAGETLGYDGDIDKRLAESLKPVGRPTAVRTKHVTG